MRSKLINLVNINGTGYRRKKELGEKNKGKEFKKEMTKDKAAKIITNEINSRAKLNKADKYLQFKNNSLGELKTIFKEQCNISTT